MKIKVALGLLVAIAITVLCFFNPEDTIWLPKCTFHLLTGLQCPGCGIQRAGYYLLHGQVLKALSYNWFLVLIAPYILSLIVTTYFDPKNKLQWLERFCTRPVTIYSFLALVAVWGIVRNIIGI